MNYELDNRMKLFEQACRNKNIKITHQRMEIFREVAGAVDHPDAESIYKSVRNRLPTVSLDTIYRALWLFDDLGIIKKLGQVRERARFDANLKHHHHFVCSVCGVVLDFYDDNLNNYKLPNSITKVEQSSLLHAELYGVCDNCSVEDG